MGQLIRSGTFLLISLLIGLPLYSQKTYYDEEMLNWRDQQPSPASQCYHSILLIGDVKYPATDSTVVMLMKEKIELMHDNGSVIILGDIIYPKGLPGPNSAGYIEAKADLDMILRKLDDFKGNIVFTPGNHDWDKGGKQGLEKVLFQQDYIINSLGSEDVYFPKGGCPGPVELHLSKDIVVIIIDSEWWFYQHDKPGSEDGCGFEEPDDIFIQIEDIIRRNEDKKIMIACHHPLFSVGMHGGYFNASRNIFPLIDIKPWLYIPLPGFIGTGYRKYFGHVSDLANPIYKQFISNMLSVVEEYPNIIYAAGHEHNLQYFMHKNLFHVISGGAAEGSYIAGRDKKTDFASMSRGIAMLNFYNNDEVWIEYWAPSEKPGGELIFRQHLYTHKPIILEDQQEDIPVYIDSTVTARLTTIYDNGNFVRFLMGDNYRAEWKAKVTFPVFDIVYEKGGLNILKRGGGQQTRSVRMEAQDGKQYVLRSVNKYVEKALDEELQNTIAEAAVQDGISSSHPYAALTVPVLAEAANVMHTNPKVVWVPDDPRLGIYRRDLANNVFLFEERPAGDWSDAAFFGNAKDIISTPKMIKKTQDQHDHLVDQESVVNARLFDMYINDWDRHDDQWRWAVFKENDTKVYRPIPRDRDQTYFLNEGPVMWLVRQDFIMPKFQGFDHEIRNVKGLGFNARYFDRAFMNEPGLDTWLETAKRIQASMTDSVINAAIKQLPPEIYKLSGEEIISKLKARRDLIPAYAEEYYKFLAKEVDIVATNERDLFKVDRLKNGNTEVSVFALSDKKGKVKEQIYSREFNKEETKEIRLYGLEGKDRIEISGEAKNAIKLRVIGGKNNDTVIDRSNIRGWKKTVWVYDRKDKKNFIEKGTETRLILSNDKTVDDYNRKQYKYDRAMPLIGGGFNVDDGFFLGAGVNIKRYNFRDSTSHKIMGKIAFATGAFSIDYKGVYAVAATYFDIELDASVALPRNVDNYFGLGNQTRRITDDKSFYRVRYSYAYVNPWLKHTVNDKVNYKFGAFYQFFEPTDTNDRYIGDIGMSGLDSSSYMRHHYTGINAAVEIDTRNSKVLPQRGMFFNTDLHGYYGLNEESKNFVRLRSDLRFYLSFKKDPRFVFVLRFGGAMNFGNYEFFHANTLGGKTNLRGFVSRRFAGDHSFYQNTEIRVKLFNLRSYIMNGQLGIMVFNDIGRVWYEDEKSQSWHDGFGGGIWISPFDFTALTLNYQHSYDDSMFVFTFSFLF